LRTLYRAARVHTLSHPATGAWLLVDDRHVQRVGTGEPPTSDRTVDLPGATIVPGFIDAHVHLTSTGLSATDQRVAAARSAGELLALAADRAGEGSGLVLLQGFDESRWDAPRFPSRSELDALTDRPLVIRRTDFHLALANSAALRAADIWDEPGTLRGDDASPDGRVTQEAMQRLARWTREALTDHEIQELQLKAAAIAASKGVTSVHEMSMPIEAGDRDLAVFLAHRSRLPVDAVPVVATTDIPRVIDLGLGSIGGDLPVDGSIGARTAALLAPYEDGEEDGHGTAYFSDDELVAFFHGGHAAGLQVGVHAIGDRAIDQILTAWERVYHALDSRQRRHFRARRHRVEHFEMASDAAVERAAMLGLAVSVQPVFDLWWGAADGLYETKVGAERAAAMNPFRTMIERGIEVGAGSDTPITPLDPLLAVHALESHHAPRQRLSRPEAIRLHTIGSARLAHQEEKKGALEPGMHADFVVYDADPFEAADLRGIEPILTVSLGREVFAA
jgi:predicted amidohydrolase YtcJ